HPRHHLLSDIATLVEIDTVKAVHVGFVWKSVAIDEVETAAGGADGNAVRLIGGAADKLRADQAGRLWRKIGGDENPQAQLGVTWIGEGEIWLQGHLTIPRGEYTEAVGKIFDADLGAQSVEGEFVGKRLRKRFRAINQKAAAMSGRRLGDQEIDRDLALGRQQRAEAA